MYECLLLEINKKIKKHTHTYIYINQSRSIQVMRFKFSSNSLTEVDISNNLKTKKKIYKQNNIQFILVAS